MLEREDEQHAEKLKQAIAVGKAKPSGIANFFCPPTDIERGDKLLLSYEALARFYARKNANKALLLLFSDAFNEPLITISHYKIRQLMQELLAYGRVRRLDEALSYDDCFKLITSIQCVVKSAQGFYQTVIDQGLELADSPEKKATIIQAALKCSLKTENRLQLMAKLVDTFTSQKAFTEALRCLDDCTTELSQSSGTRLLKYLDGFQRLVTMQQLLHLYLNKSARDLTPQFEELLHAKHWEFDFIPVDGEANSEHAQALSIAIQACQHMGLSLPQQVGLKLANTPGEVAIAQQHAHIVEQTSSDVVPEVIEPPSSLDKLKENLRFDWQSLGVAGYKKEISDIVKALFLPRLLPDDVTSLLKLEPSKGLLLHGPAGTGKTFIARIIANYFFAPEQVISVRGPELLNRFVGQSAENLRALFNVAIKNPKKTYVYIFDEMDSAFHKRSEGSSAGTQTSNDLTSQLLTLLDGVEPLDNVIIIGTTNFRENMDGALLRSGRMQTHIEIGLPTEEDRLAILSLYMQPLIGSGLVASDIDLLRLAKACDGLSSAALKQVVNDTKLLLLDSLFVEGDEGISFDVSQDLSTLSLSLADFLATVKAIKPDTPTTPLPFFDNKAKAVEPGREISRKLSCTF